MKNWAALLSIAIALSACSNLGEFEHELTGNEAKAWSLCKRIFGDRVYSPPPYGETDENHILLAWNTEDAEREGGPLFCRANGDGIKLIEAQMSESA